eukprot:gene57697-biopygen17165
MLPRYAAALCVASWLAAAHRSFPHGGVTCGEQFSTPDDALVIPNPQISWATSRILTCDAPIFWLEGDMVAGFNVQFTSLQLVIDRFETVRTAVAVIGPGLVT